MSLKLRLASAALFLCLAIMPARAEWIEIDEWIAYDLSTAAYDSEEDILGVLIDDWSYESEGWLYVQCGTGLTWFDNPAPGRWDALEQEYIPIRDALCAQRHTLPFRDF